MQQFEPFSRFDPIYKPQLERVDSSHSLSIVQSKRHRLVFPIFEKLPSKMRIYKDVITGKLKFKRLYIRNLSSSEINQS